MCEASFGEFVDCKSKQSGGGKSEQHRTVGLLLDHAERSTEPLRFPRSRIDRRKDKEQPDQREHKSAD